ncbi:Multimodular transpeptidase-transglycosylase [hydrothermal vent metagenome]|uniref:Penicillin-binding protein 1A n=1 Tax=hydrothermal vent metagenome TaxID=652676 RepID=A0A3B0YH60_9ZZZZ
MLYSLCMYVCLASNVSDLTKLSQINFYPSLRIYSAEGKLLAQYGERKRTVVKFKEIPNKLVSAFVAIIDPNIYTPEKRSKKSMKTIRELDLFCRSNKKTTNNNKESSRKKNSQHNTQSFTKLPGPMIIQLTRYLISARRPRTRFSLCELVSISKKIKASYSKKQVLEAYLNNIYLGVRTFGVGAAAKKFYNKKLQELSLSQIAMLAALVGSANEYSPRNNPEKARARRMLVLSRMLKQQYITQQEFTVANQQPLEPYTYHNNVKSPYIAEMVKQHMQNNFSNKLNHKGYDVYTTISAKHQRLAEAALRKSLMAYSRRHGYRGVLANNPLNKKLTKSVLFNLFKNYHVQGHLVPALVVAVTKKQATIYLKDGRKGLINWEGVQWARQYISVDKISAPVKTINQVLRRGDIIYAELGEKNRWLLAQVPRVQGALVSLNPMDGAIAALVGGFAFHQRDSHGRFNRAINARRSPGTVLTPFIYAAALAKGMSVATLKNVGNAKNRASISTKNLLGNVSANKQSVPIKGMDENAKEMPVVSLLKKIGVEYFVAYAKKFSITKSQLPTNLAVKLDGGEFALYQLTAAYAVFANGGYKVKPYFISRIEAWDEGVVFQYKSALNCKKCKKSSGNISTTSATKRIQTAQVNLQLNTLLRTMLPRGAACTVSQGKGRTAIVAKEGSSQNQNDAWFIGYSPKVVTSVWMGFDSNRSLGSQELGAVAAFPAWFYFMQKSLAGSMTCQ